jgi:cold shock CspA family protein
MSNNGRQGGVVKMWNEDRGFGFLATDVYREVFFHHGQLVDDCSPYKGQRCSFVIDRARDGRDFARQVIVNK